MQESAVSMIIEYPIAPIGSCLPPKEFIDKMRLIDKFDSYQESQEEDEIQEEFLANRFGMFDQPLFTYDNLPCSLHFDHSKLQGVPSGQAKDAMGLLHTNLLGKTFGAKVGNYGGSGGGVHILYLGLPFEASGEICDSFPGIDTLLTMLHLSDIYKPEAMQWMTTTDPIHQDLFSKYRDETLVDAKNGDNPSVLSLDDVVNLLVPSPLAHVTTIPTTRIVSSEQIPPHVTANYPSLEHGRVLFLLPRFAHLHDGDCLRKPTLCPTALAFYERSRAHQHESWTHFQNRPEHNHGVFLETTAASSEGKNESLAKEACDIFESPVLCLFQLEETWEILALVQWDYRS